MVVGVCEETIDAVEATAGMGEPFNDALNNGDRIEAVVVTETALAAVDIDEDGSERVEGPCEFAGGADHGGQVRREQFRVVAKVVTTRLQRADRRIDQADSPVHDLRVPVR